MFGIKSYGLPVTACLLTMFFVGYSKKNATYNINDVFLPENKEVILSRKELDRPLLSRTIAHGADGKNRSVVIGTRDVITMTTDDMGHNILTFGTEPSPKKHFNATIIENDIKFPTTVLMDPEDTYYKLKIEEESIAKSFVKIKEVICKKNNCTDKITYDTVPKLVSLSELLSLDKMLPR